MLIDTEVPNYDENCSFVRCRYEHQRSGSKMKDAAKAEDYECDITAHSVSEAKNYQSADMILLGPQVRYRLKEVQGELPNNKVEVIDMKDYGMMNGKAVLDHVRKVLEG